MSRNRFLPILLVAALVAQVVIAGWGHSHSHPCGTLGHAPELHTQHGLAGHSHHQHSAGELHHFGDSHQHSPLPHQPSDKDDCSICRHLALAAILTLDLEPLAVGDSAEPVKDRESILASTIAIGLRRPRSPPELS